MQGFYETKYGWKYHITSEEKTNPRRLTNWPIHQFAQTNKLFGQPVSLIASEFYSTDEMGTFSLYAHS